MAYASLLVTLTFLSLASAAIAAEHLTTLYVATDGRDGNAGGSADQPLASIREALDVAAVAITKAGTHEKGVRIVLHGGRYCLSDTIRIDANGPWPLAIEAHEGERPVISGGVKLPSDWQIETVGGREVWTQTLTRVQEGKWYFRQLWVNGKRASVPVMPKKTGAPNRFTKRDFYKIAELDIPADKMNVERRWMHASLNSFHFSAGEFRASWRDLTDAWIVLNCRWYHNFMPVASVDEQNRLVCFTREAVNALLHSHPSHGTGVHDHVTKPLNWRTFYDTAYYRLYNVFETLAEPGEFYLDRRSGKLYYVPREGETPETADVVAPRLNQLLVATSDADDGYIKGLTLRGLTFSHTSLKPENHRGPVTDHRLRAQPSRRVRTCGRWGHPRPRCGGQPLLRPWQWRVQVVRVLHQQPRGR